MIEKPKYLQLEPHFQEENGAKVVYLWSKSVHTIEVYISYKKGVGIWLLRYDWLLPRLTVVYTVLAIVPWTIGNKLVGGGRFKTQYLQLVPL